MAGRWLPLVFLAMAALAIAACIPTRENDLFCCASEQTCNTNHGPGVLTPCRDPARPYCDDLGEHGTPRTCIPDPMASSCGTSDDCSEERPHCVNRTCVQCETREHCTTSAPVCNQVTHLCQGCADHDDCAGFADAPRCREASGACVACLGSEDCSGTAPICDAFGCRACVAHDECGSGVCERDLGSCVDGARVIYVSPTGQASGTCTREAPCDSFARALMQVTAQRNVIKAAPGTYSGQVLLDGVTVTIVAPGATIQPTGENQVAVAVTNGANVTIEDATITQARGPNLPAGVTCTGVTSTVRLHGTTVVANIGGGVSITACQFSLVNNVIALNGGVTSAIGGVEIGGITSSGLREIAFNTITANGGTSGVNTGVNCGTVTVPLTFSNNIVYGNQVSGNGAQVGGDSDCAWSYSAIGPQGVSGTGNISSDPQFVDPGSRDFHLRPTSPARDAADPAATLRWDIDGDPRPQGDRRDIGADEVVE